MAPFTEVAGIPEPSNAAGADMREGDFLAVPEARHYLQPDRGAVLLGFLPLDPQELWLWLHRFKPAAQHCWA